jgi:hypothetical protein
MYHNKDLGPGFVRHFLTVARLIGQFLSATGVRHVFGLSGHSTTSGTSTAP